MRFVFRLLLVIAGLIFAASLMVAMFVVLLAWGLRTLWRKLTGQPSTPFEMRLNPRAGFDQVFRRGSRETVKPSRRVMDDVTDVEPKR